jgi:hypothetical protein
VVDDGGCVLTSCRSYGGEGLIIVFEFLLDEFLLLVFEFLSRGLSSISMLFFYCIY